jgi:hypothetical protein
MTTRPFHTTFNDAVPSSGSTRPRAWRDVGFGILVVTRALVKVKVWFYRVFRRVVKKRKSQLPRNWEISLAFRRGGGEVDNMFFRYIHKQYNVVKTFFTYLTSPHQGGVQGLTQDASNHCFGRPIE